VGKDDEAVRELRNAVELNPESAIGHHYLGAALINLQEFDEAEKELRQAVKLEPSARNHYYLAACLISLNRYEEALGEMQTAARMDPEQNLYRARLDELVRLMKTSTAR
jgi:tetratricopeptide (TPR) repeat protein